MLLGPFYLGRSPAVLCLIARSTESVKEKSVEDVENPTAAKGSLTGTDEDFGGTAERLRLEKKLLRKLDMRMSILIVIYILNYVSGMIY